MKCAILTRAEAAALSELLYEALPLADARDLPPRRPAPNAAVVLTRLRWWLQARRAARPASTAGLRRAG